MNLKIRLAEHSSDGRDDVQQPEQGAGFTDLCREKVCVCVCVCVYVDYVCIYVCRLCMYICMYVGYVCIYVCRLCM